MISLAQQGSSAPEQGSDAWHLLRKKRMTGSKPAGLMFEMKSAEDWDRLHSEIFGNAKPPPFSEEAIARMNYGSETEDVAAELLQKNMPGSLLFECPLVAHPCLNWVAASPDGYLIEFEHENGNILPELKVKKRWNVEIKCPLYELLSKPVEMKKKFIKKFKHIPYYYACQIHFEMVMSKCASTLFVVYSPVRTHIWKLEFDEAYWRQSLDVLKTFKDRCSTYENLAAKVKDWVSESRRYAQRYKVWKVIEPATTT